MGNALAGFSFNGMLPVTPAAFGATTLAMLILALVLGGAALTLVRFAIGGSGGERAAPGACGRRWTCGHHRGARTAGSQRASQRRSRIAIVRIAP